MAGRLDFGFVDATFLSDLDEDIRIETTTSISTVDTQCFTDNHLKIIHINIRSIERNFNEFLTFLSGLQVAFDVVVLTETWHLERSGSNYSIPGYRSHYNHGFVNRCDGVAIFSKTHLDARFDKLDLPGCNASCISFKFQSTQHEILAVYRSPSLNPSDFISSLSNYLYTTTK